MNKYIYALNKRLSSLYIALFDRQFDNDKNFKIKNLEQFFFDNPSNYLDNFFLIELCDFYIKIKNNQNSKGSEYQVGNEWQPIFNKYMKEIQNILKGKAVSKLSKKYNTFFREPFSAGLHGDSGYDRFKRRYLSKKISFIDKNLYVKSCLHSFNTWKKLIKEKEILFNLDDFDVPSIGNQYNFQFDGRIINPNYFISHYYANVVAKLIKPISIEKKYVFELGGGYGAFAYFLMKHDNHCYIGCDLPENLCLTAFFLKSLLPNKKIKLVSDLKVEKFDFSQYDIILISNYDIENLPETKIVLSYNSYSLAEMHSEAIQNYMSHISRITNKFIFHINHIQYSKVSAENFNIDSKKFNLVEKKLAIWNRYKNKLSDEYEYLYEKK